MDTSDSSGKATDLSSIQRQWDRIEQKLDRLAALSEGVLRARGPDVNGMLAGLPPEVVGAGKDSDGAPAPNPSAGPGLAADCRHQTSGSTQSSRQDLGSASRPLEGGAVQDGREGTRSAENQSAPPHPPAGADGLGMEWTVSAATVTSSSRSRPPALQEAPEALPDPQAHETPEADSSFVASTLPLDWPAVLSIREGFHALSCAASHRGHTRTKVTSFVSESGSDVTHLEIKNAMPVSWFIIDPNSWFHMLYSIFSLVVLFYDLTLLPYALAWELEYIGWLQVSTVCTALFWTVDMGISFVTGFYQAAGELQMDFRSVAKQYLRTWFAPDLAVVFSDWLSFAISEATNGPKSSRGIKMLRFMKLGRLVRITSMLRMIRAVRIFEDFAERALTEGYRVALNMVSLFSCIMWVAHLLSCLWFAVGKSGPTDTGERWTDGITYEAGGETVTYLQTGPLNQYTVAFHWAAGQVALGNFDIMPTNSLERIVFVLAMMVGFLFGSTLVAMLSAAVMDYQMMQKDQNMKLRVLRQYLRQSGVGPTTTMMVQKQAVQRLAQRTRLEETDVLVLSLLSHALRSQLRFEIQSPHLLQHPVFRLWTSLDLRLMQRICMKAVSFINLRSKDDLFAAGTVASAAYSLVEGEISYLQHPDSSPVETETRTMVYPGSLLSEAALWTEWTHVGRAEATMPCTLLEIDAENLVESLQRGAAIKGLAGEYCKHFHKRVTAARPPHAPWPNDLEVPYTDYCDMVVGMAKEVQVTIGMDALSQLTKTKGRWPTKAMDKLCEEVRTAKSILVVTGQGSIIRVVSLVVMRLQRPDQRILAQIGKWDGFQFEADCRLPGMKQERGELIGETITRMLGTKLQLLAGRVDIEGITRQHTEMMSKEYGVQTRYLRSVCRARLPLGQEPLGIPVLRPRSPSQASPTTPRRSSVISDSIYSPRARARTPPASDLDDGCLLAGLLATDVLQVPSGGDTALYAWLPPETFDLLSGGTATGDQALKAWLAELPTPQKSEVLFTFKGEELVVVAI